MALTAYSVRQYLSKLIIALTQSQPSRVQDFDIIQKKPLNGGAERLYDNESYINSMSFIVDLAMCHHQQKATRKDELGSNLSLLIKETGH